MAFFFYLMADNSSLQVVWQEPNLKDRGDAMGHAVSGMKSDYHKYVKNFFMKLQNCKYKTYLLTPREYHFK